DSRHFSGQISGFGLPDMLDLTDIADNHGQATLAFKEANNHTSGTLTVSDGVHTAKITLLGQYVASQFHVGNDGAGGTLVTDPPVTALTDPGTIGIVAPHHT